MRRRLAVSLLLIRALRSARIFVGVPLDGERPSVRHCFLCALDDSGVWRADKRIAKGRFKSPRRGIPLNIPALA